MKRRKEVDGLGQVVYRKDQNLITTDHTYGIECKNENIIRKRNGSRKLPCQSGNPPVQLPWKLLDLQSNCLNAVPRHLKHQKLPSASPNLCSQGIHGCFAAKLPNSEVQLLPPAQGHHNFYRTSICSYL